MDQQHVYHYHHHHYHYHYTYPFPPGIPPNAPQNDEGLNQEAADHENDEALAEDEEEGNEEENEEENEEGNEEWNEEERSERGDTEDQQTPKDRSPSPVQQDEPLTKLGDPSRVGLAVFDDYFSIFNLDAQSAKAQARWANPQSNNEDHSEGPPRKKARTSANPEQPISRGEASNSATRTQKSDHITIVDKALVIDSDKAFRVFNCDPSGPQVNICYRVPGPRNLWLGRIGDPTGEPLKAIMSLMGAERKPGFGLTTFIMSPADAEGTISMILCSSSDRSHDEFERGDGHVHDADQPDTPTIRGRPRHSEDDTPDMEDEPRTEETVVNVVDELPRSGLVIFDDCVSLIRVDNLSERARNRWREEEQQHQEQSQETQPQSQIPPSIYDGSAPILSSPRLTQISRACIIASHGFYVVNCDTSGPQPRWKRYRSYAFDHAGDDAVVLSEGAVGGILNVNISDPDSMPTKRTKSRAERRRRKALRRAQGNELQNIAVPGPAKAENDAPTLSKVPSQNIGAQNASRAPQADAPVQAEATRYVTPQGDTSQDDAGASYWRPRVPSYNLLRILPAVEISTDPKLLIRNPRKDGPQIDICARIPGTLNNWAAHVSCYDSLHDLYDWILGKLGEEHPEMLMYVSDIRTGFVNFHQMPLLSLIEPLSFIIISNPGGYLPWNWMEPPSEYTSSCPAVPRLHGVLGPEGSKWLRLCRRSFALTGPSTVVTAPDIPTLGHETLGEVVFKDCGTLWRQEILAIEDPELNVSFFHDILRVKGRTWNLGRRISRRLRRRRRTASSTSGPQTQGADTQIRRVNVILQPNGELSAPRPRTPDRETQFLRVNVILQPNDELRIVVNNTHPDDPPTNHFADFESADEMRDGTSFYATRDTILSMLHRIRSLVYPDGTEFDVDVEEPHGRALWIVV
ncbi:uncharacterized protein FTJAE_13389 [Fusarium tjaetaba]|uniref:Uncharacterized protein n=1 Tax=Fusarium tjaetaba TaxID=1567544 RepID=A0A8H5V9E5_9HYPO|nr:uncharacterized protein FTJAE_13389 [Fusarium tjaetaba]KAF5615346.1 hypothetical protein FTJAE_13389 [Fusarium tjaetaba]